MYQQHMLLRGLKFHLSARNYEWNLERMRNSPHSSGPVKRVLLDELLEEVITYYSPIFFIAYSFKGR